MGTLEGWGAIAASFLLVQCIVFNVIWVALALGLWQGTAWLRGQAGPALAKVGGWLQTGRGYVQRGERIVAGPFIRLRGRAEGARVAWRRLRG